MKRELRDQWCAALRSGEYVQGKRLLRYDTCDGTGLVLFCCLGVLRHICDPHDRRAEVFISGQFLAEKQLRQYGLSHAQQKELASANDSGESFGEIADLIEAVVKLS